MNAEVLKHFDRISDAPEAVPRLRQFILDLAVRGKVVPQQPNDEPASALLKRIAIEKAMLVKSGEIKTQEAPTVIREDEIEFHLPSGWCWTRLATISRRIHYGFTASADESLTDVRLLRITDIQNNSVDWSTVPGCQISNEEVSQYRLAHSDILIARTGGTIGKTFLVTDVPPKAVFASYLIRVQPSAELCDRYLKLFLESPVYWKQLQEGTRGTGQPNVNGQTLGRLTIAFPPLAEQHRIVAKVRELMELCDRLEEAQKERKRRRDRLTAAVLHQLNNGTDQLQLREHSGFFIRHLSRFTYGPEQIGKVRSAILNLAVRGRLVRQTLTDEPVSDLLKRIAEARNRLGKAGRIKNEKQVEFLETRNEPFPVPESWKWVRLETLTRLITKGSSPKWQGVNYVDSQDGILFITSENVGSYELRKLDDLKYVERKFNMIEPRSILQRGDILMNLVGASIGRTALFHLDVEANINQAVALIRLVETSEGLDFRYLLHYFNSPPAVAFMLGSRVTTAQPNMSLTDARGFPIPVPPRAEQERIVAMVDELMTVCNRLEEQLTSRQTVGHNLLEAMLHESLRPAAVKA